MCSLRFEGRNLVVESGGRPREEVFPLLVDVTRRGENCRLWCMVRVYRAQCRASRSGGRCRRVGLCVCSGQCLELDGEGF